jgi:hypothetical protein
MMDEIGEACGMEWGEEKCLQGFGGKTWRKNHLEDVELDGG